MNVLFVDDDPMVLRALDRTLSPLSEDWTMHFRASAHEAWQLLDEQQIDVVVTDMRMPDVDGSTLLADIRDRIPGTVRMVLSGLKNHDSALRSTEGAHRSMAKPVRGLDLVSQIRYAVEVRPDDVSMRSLVNGTVMLPSQPVVVDRLRAELSSSHATSTTVAAIAGTDVALTAKVLQLANSAFFNKSQERLDLISCIEAIGVATLQSLMSYNSLFRVYEVSDSRNADIALAHEHVLETRLPFSGIDHLGSILHIAGNLLLIDAGMSGQLCACVSSETRDLSISLLQLWGVPRTIVESLKYQCSVDGS